eukprot:GEMP01046223.1.p1 GENE.GEMP01046223.1~~GEMP01046223.1.p1  ORF type:complete len:356 (+),score=68.33 GEMP01046223.1:125-1192(+)
MKALQKLGYEYDAEDTLRSKDGSKFAWKGQEHYTELADAVQQLVQEKLHKQLEPRTMTSGCPIFVKDLSAKKILVILQGSGRVKPGVWGCAICINEDGGLTKGTMLSYIKKARDAKYGIIILNPNWVPDDPESECGNTSPSSPPPSSRGASPSPGDEAAPKRIPTGKHHVVQAWREIVMPLVKKGARVDVVAHSAGGRCFLHLLNKCDELAQSVRRVALTDSYHSYEQVENLSDVGRKVLDGCINYVCSEENFGTDVEEWESLGSGKRASRIGCACISAACKDHAMTNFAALDDIFKWFSETSERKLKIPMPPQPQAVACELPVSPRDKSDGHRSRSDRSRHASKGHENATSAKK